MDGAQREFPLQGQQKRGVLGLGAVLGLCLGQERGRAKADTPEVGPSSAKGRHRQVFGGLMGTDPLGHLLRLGEGCWGD